MINTTTPRSPEKKRDHAAHSSTIAAGLQKENQELANKVRSLEAKLEKADLDLSQAKAQQDKQKSQTGALEQQQKQIQFELEQKLKKREEEFEERLRKKDDEIAATRQAGKDDMEQLRNDMMQQIKDSSRTQSGDLAAVQVKITGLEANIRTTQAQMDQKEQQLKDVRELCGPDIKHVIHSVGTRNSCGRMQRAMRKGMSKTARPVTRIAW